MFKNLYFNRTFQIQFVFLILFASHSNAAVTMGRPNINQVIKYVVDGISAVLSGKALAPIAKETTQESIRADLLPAQRTIEDRGERLGIFAEAREFNWAEYQRLEQAFDNREYMSMADLQRLQELRQQYDKFDSIEGFEAPAETQGACAGNGRMLSIPGVHQFGCGAYTSGVAAKADKYAGKTAEQAVKTWLDDELDSEFGLAGVHPGIEKEKINLGLAMSGILKDGVLNLSLLTLDQNEWVAVLDSIPSILADLVVDMDFSDSQNLGVLPNLKRFRNLNSFRASNCKISVIKGLPSSLTQLIMDNRNTITDWSFVGSLTRLRTVYMNFAEMKTFPIELYNRLKQNHRHGSMTHLSLVVNPISSVPLDLMTGTVLLTIDNSADLVQQLSNSDIDRLGAICFNGTYPDLIVDGLYLGDESDLTSAPMHAKLGITRLINCANELSKKAKEMDSPEVQALNLHLDDVDSQQIPLMVHAQTLRTYIQSGHTVLVNCKQGKSRSATLVIAYLMIYEGKNLVEAIKYVRSRRSIICPNPGFMSQLVDVQLQINPSLSRKQVLDDLARELPDMDVASRSSGAAAAPLVTDGSADMFVVVKSTDNSFGDVVEDDGSDPLNNDDDA